MFSSAVARLPALVLVVCTCTLVVAERFGACPVEGSFDLELCRGRTDGMLAWADWEDSNNVTGWGMLKVFGNMSHRLEDQARGMGFAEGVATQTRIYEAKSNMFAHAFGQGQPASPKVADWFAKQLAYVRKEVKAWGPQPSQQQEQDRSDDNGFISKTLWWRSLGVVMSQFDGLLEGYNSVAPPSQQMSELDMYIHNGAGDLEDLGSVLMGDTWRNSLLFPDINMLDCSAFVKLTADDVLAGHTTWRDYGNMAPRAYKTYHMHIPAHTAHHHSAAYEWAVSFSSTPGFLSSKDDFYTIKSDHANLVVMETTNGIFNRTLYSLLHPHTVLTWQRTMLANLIAHTGEEWTRSFAPKNSGTYNNQWIVLDVDNYASSVRVKEGVVAPANTLWILEQIPGTTHAADVTDVLNAQGYFASYNIPYFPLIYNLSGYDQQQGDAYRYDKCARANIFRARAGEVQTIEDIKKLMQYNDYQNDPLSLGSPLNAISSRYDLVETNPRAFGGIDSKVTSGKLASSLFAHAISGPTQQQAVFSWATFHGTPTQHAGQPDVFAFPWVKVGGMAEVVCSFNHNMEWVCE